MTKDQDLVFLPLGGVGEIGMNLALYGYGSPKNREWIMVDCGVTFPGPELPGVDLILPDIDFVKKLGSQLKAIIITHAHEDHYGGLAQLWPQLKAPVYASAFTVGMLEAKRAYERTRAEVPVNVFKAGERFTAGPFEIEPIAVNHSIPEPFSLAIGTPLGKLIHTGDWKIDMTPSLGPLTDENRFRELGEEGILAMMCDSTNAMRDGVSPSEKEISAGLRGVIEQAEGRVAITTFSSNVGRIRSIAEAARDAGREVLLLGSSIKRVVNVARDLGMMEGIPEFLAEDEFGYIPRDKVVIILTGSQGEPRAALAKLSRDEMRNVALASGDTVVFSSRAIPGNEKGIIDIKNGLIEQGVKIVTDQDALVHVSGHPRRTELVQMYEIGQAAGSWCRWQSTWWRRGGTGGRTQGIKIKPRVAANGLDPAAGAWRAGKSMRQRGATRPVSYKPGVPAADGIIATVALASPEYEAQICTVYEPVHVEVSMWSSTQRYRIHQTRTPNGCTRPSASPRDANERRATNIEDKCL